MLFARKRQEAKRQRRKCRCQVKKFMLMICSVRNARLWWNRDKNIYAVVTRITWGAKENISHWFMLCLANRENLFSWNAWANTGVSHWLNFGTLLVLILGKQKQKHLWVRKGFYKKFFFLEFKRLSKQVQGKYSNMCERFNGLKKCVPWQDLRKKGYNNFKTLNFVIIFLQGYFLRLRT